MSWAYQPLLPSSEQQSPDLEQESFRFYADGTETGASALAAQDSNHTADISGGDVNLGLRIRLHENSGGNGAATDDYQLQYELNDSGTWYDIGDGAPGTPSLVDSYSESNQNIDHNPSSDSDLRGQSFTGNGSFISSVEVYLKNSGVSPANVNVYIYSHTGTYGSTGVPGTLLATSDNYSTSNIGGSYALHEYTFSGANQIELVNGTKFFLVVDLQYSGATQLSWGADNSSPSHGGNAASRGFSSWSADSSADACFYVYGASPSPVVEGYDSSNLTDASTTTNRLGVTSVTTVEDNYNDNSIDTAKWSNWGGGNVTETANQIQVVTGTANGDAYGMDTIWRGNFTNHRVSHQIVDDGIPRVNGQIIPIQVTQSSGNATYWYVENGSAYCMKAVGGVYTQVGSSRTHTDNDYYSVREQNGTTYWDYSTDGVTWTNQYSEANPITYTNIYISFLTYNNAVVTSTTVKFDNFKLEAGNFSAGEISEDGLVDGLAITAYNFSELLYSLTLVAAELADTDTLDFRVLRNGNPLDSYTVTPRITAQDSGGGSYTLTADSGSFTITGTSASLEFNRLVVAASGSYTITGTTASLEYSRKLVAAAGSYAISGTAATLTTARKLTATGGTYTITGTAASLEYSRILTASSGSFTVTGVAATLIVTRKITASAGSYTITGTDASLKYARKFSVDSGTYTITGTAAALGKGLVMMGGAGSFTITGTNVNFLYNRKLVASSGSVTITGTTASLEFNRKLTASATTYAITGTDASFKYSMKFAADSGSYAIIGTSASLKRVLRLVATAGSYQITGSDATFEYEQTIRLNAEPGSFVITGSDVDFVIVLPYIRYIYPDNTTHDLTNSTTQFERWHILWPNSNTHDLTDSVPYISGGTRNRASASGITRSKPIRVSTGGKFR